VFETRANLRLCDTLPGFGYIMDACLGIDRSQEDAPVQQLALLHGGERPARFDLCRVGDPLAIGSVLPHAYHSLHASAWTRSQTRSKARRIKCISRALVPSETRAEGSRPSWCEFPRERIVSMLGAGLFIGEARLPRLIRGRALMTVVCSSLSKSWRVDPLILCKTSKRRR
jgi:hypothetical protein